MASRSSGLPKALQQAYELFRFRSYKTEAVKTAMKCRDPRVRHDIAFLVIRQGHVVLKRFAHGGPLVHLNSGEATAAWTQTTAKSMVHPQDKNLLSILILWFVAKGDRNMRPLALLFWLANIRDDAPVIEHRSGLRVTFK